MLTTGVAQSGSVSLYFELCGSGPLVVFIHGQAQDHRVWSHQVASLSEHFTVLTYDLRGHGVSSDPIDVAWDHQSDLAFLLSYLNRVPAVLVGLSLGGHVAQAYALSCSEVLKGVVLIDSALHGYRYAEETMALFTHVFDVCHKEGVESARAAWLDLPLFDCVRKQPYGWVLIKKMCQEYRGWYWHNRVDPHMASGMMPLSDRFAKWSVPVTCWVGEHDLLDFHQIVAQWVQCVPQAESYVWSGCGHLPPLEQAETVSERLLEVCHCYCKQS